MARIGPEIDYEIDNETGIEYARLLSKRLQKRKTYVRSAFFHRSDPSDDAPPATLLLRNRSQDGLQVKLALFYLWSAGSENPDPITEEAHTVNFRDEDVALLFGLPEPAGNGRRRIANARKRLSARECPLIELEAKPGKPPLVRIMREDGSGSAYLPPGAPGGGGDYYPLPLHFWTNGWHLALSGPAVVALLVLLRMEGTTSQRELWVNPTFRERYLGFSEDTWYRGVTQLWQHGIVKRGHKAIRRPFEDEARRRRFTYQLNIHRFQESGPADPRDPMAIIRQDSVASSATT